MSASGRAPLTVTQRSVVDATAPQVWERITDFTGINHELMPWMRMRVPRRYADWTIDDITPGEPLGRVWIFYLGVLPLDWDDLVVVELEPGRRFLERSSMASMRRWQHERVIEQLDDGRCAVIDRLVFEPRLPLRPLRPLLRRVIAFLFAHRHRRLAAYFG